ncbi:hypothetical protein OKW40_001026 [Paraburkholderia sp. RAU6.4a]|uniref:hypothetical protein n=1 Tax=Paraburkholderia TaxID=1822464 RepID=UPI000A69DCAA|nr:hypothetical protein [Paraburkholderia tuberum]
MSLPERALCNDGLVSRYEDLRQQALGLPCEIPRGQGLVLLMRSGMRAWMQAWAQCATTVVRRQPPPPGEAEIVPFKLHQEATMILASMLLYGRQEATA